MIYLTKFLIALALPVVFSAGLYPFLLRFKTGRETLFMISAGLSLLALLYREMYGRTVTWADITVYPIGVFVSVLSLNYYFSRRSAWLDVAALTEVFAQKYRLPRDLHLRHLLQIALINERQGRGFYLSLARQARRSQTKDLCLRIADDEANHEAVMQRTVSQWMPLKPGKEIMSRTTEIMRAQGIFSDPPGPDASEHDLLQYAVRQEEAFVEFYQAFERAFPEAWKRIQLQEIIMMERSHAQQLRDLLDSAA